MMKLPEGFALRHINNTCCKLSLSCYINNWLDTLSEWQSLLRKVVMLRYSLVVKAEHEAYLLYEILSVFEAFF